MAEPLGFFNGMAETYMDTVHFDSRKLLRMGLVPGPLEKCENDSALASAALAGSTGLIV